MKDPTRDQYGDHTATLPRAVIAWPRAEPKLQVVIPPRPGRGPDQTGYLVLDVGPDTPAHEVEVAIDGMLDETRLRATIGLLTAALARIDGPVADG